MKTITEIKQHFSDNEIKLCVDIIKGKLEFSVLEEQIKDFYAEENIDRDKLLDQLESDFDFWGIVWYIKQWNNWWQKNIGQYKD